MEPELPMRQVQAILTNFVNHGIQILAHIGHDMIHITVDGPLDSRTEVTFILPSAECGKAAIHTPLLYLQTVRRSVIKKSINMVEFY